MNVIAIFLSQFFFLMKPRTIAIIILTILILLPIFLYWYFYKSKVTSIIFENDSEANYTIYLKGTFKYKYFPLLDKAFSYQSTCKKSCIFSPVPPLEYNLTISSTGSEEISGTLTPEAGESLKYQVHFIPSLIFTPFGSFSPGSARDNQDGSIGQTQWWKKVFLKREWINDTGLYIGERSRPNFVFSLPVRSARLDASRSYLIVQWERSEQYIFSLDWQNKVIFPYEEPIEIISFSDTWKVRTTSSIYELSNDLWKKNLRFTDYIDISSRYRIGYIDIRDPDKLALANLPPKNSLFILLDRTNTETKIIKKWREIRWFLLYEGFPAVLDRDGTLSKITINID